ncbi:MAG: hypothetical protein WKF77_17270 [Planctomycetaceae bacterium]
MSPFVFRHAATQCPNVILGKQEVKKLRLAFQQMLYPRDLLDGVTESPNEDPDSMDLTADQFFGALPLSLGQME